MATNTVRFRIDYEVNRAKLEEIKKSLMSLSKITQEDLLNLNKGMGIDEAKKSLSGLREYAEKIRSAMNNSYNSSLGTLNIEKFNKELSSLDLDKIYASFSEAGEVGKSAFRNITTQALTTNKQVKQTNKLLDDMAKTLKNVATWNISSAFLRTFTTSIERAYGYAKNLDRSLNDIRIVTNKSSDDMAKFAVEANKAAQALGAKTVDYTDASLIYYQAGLEDAEVRARTEATVKAANVTQQETSAVSDQLTAV